MIANDVHVVVYFSTAHASLKMWHWLGVHVVVLLVLCKWFHAALAIISIILASGWDVIFLESTLMHGTSVF